MASEVAIATANFFEKYGEAATARNITGRLLRFNKFGEYRAGQDEQEIPRGTALVAYMTSLSVGYVRWEDSRPAEIIMGPVGEGFVPPRREELGHTDQARWETFDDGRPRDPWQLSNSLVLLELELNEFFTFNSSSKGGLGAVGELSKIYGKHIRQKPDEMPIIELDVGRRAGQRTSNGRAAVCTAGTQAGGQAGYCAGRQTAAAAAKKIPATKPATRL